MICLLGCSVYSLCVVNIKCITVTIRMKCTTCFTTHDYYFSLLEWLFSIFGGRVYLFFPSNKCIYLDFVISISLYSYIYSSLNTQRQSQNRSGRHVIWESVTAPTNVPVSILEWLNIWLKYMYICTLHIYRFHAYSDKKKKLKHFMD